MMKLKHIALALFTATALWSCGDDYDDSAVKKEIADLQLRVGKLETWCTATNSQLSALQGLVAAIEADDYITGVSPIVEGNVETGYTITFSKSNTITVMHGTDGTTGATGEAGKDGNIPLVGIKKADDGLYYWTIRTDAEPTWLTDAEGHKMLAAQAEALLSVGIDNGKIYWKVNGEWMLDGKGNKVQATGDKGAAGANGSNGSNGATGPAGTPGQAGTDCTDPITHIDTQTDKSSVTFTLTDGTQMTLPRATDVQIFKEFTKKEVYGDDEIELVLNIAKQDFVAIKAELTSAGGVTASVKVSRTVSATPWGVTLSDPVFTDGTGSATATIDLPNDASTGEQALLKVTVVDRKGQEHSATRILECGEW